MRPEVRASARAHASHAFRFALKLIALGALYMVVLTFAFYLVFYNLSGLTTP